MQRNASPPLAESAGPVAWTVSEAAKRLGITRSAAYAYVKSGVLPSIKLGGRLLILEAAVLALVDKAMREWAGPLPRSASQPRSDADARLAPQRRSAIAASLTSGCGWRQPSRPVRQRLRGRAEP